MAKTDDGWDHHCVLITGAATRLGRSLAEALAARGAALALHFHRSAEAAETLAERLKPSARHVRLFQADLRKPREQESLAERVMRDCGKLTGLINNASAYRKTPLSTLTEREWDEILAVNLAAPVRLSVMLGLEMKRSGGGSIVQIGDWSTNRPYRDYLAYTVSKGGLETATRALARELAPDVRVNLVAPGPILLPQGGTSDLEARIRQAVPLGRLGGTSAFVEAVLFLLAEATYCTGTTLTVDGGRTLV
jgi:pteridine reductase